MDRSSLPDRRLWSTPTRSLPPLQPTGTNQTSALQWKLPRTTHTHTHTSTRTQARTCERTNRVNVWNIVVFYDQTGHSQEAELLGDNLAKCSASNLTQKGQFSPLSPIFTAQLLCTMVKVSSEDSPSDPFKGDKSWKGLNIGQSLELLLGDVNRDQASCQQSLYKLSWHLSLW
jgi:hypothetical protein